MRIAVNTRLLLKGKLEGIGWFTFETLKRITTQHPEHEFFFIFDRSYDTHFIFSDNVTPIVVSPQARHPFLYLAWFELSVPRILKKINADLFLSPDGYLSLSSKIPSIAVIHDLNFEHYPKDLPFLTSLYYRTFFPKFARKARRIATVSEYSRQDIAKQYNILPEKIDVVYNGANEKYTPLNEAGKKQTRAHYSRGCDYFLFIGSLHPRKNLSNLFLAFDKFKKQSPNDVKLLIVGAKKWWTDSIREAYDQMLFNEDVIFTGRLSDSDLQQVLASALALAYVSYFEGFGIPIVEAFYSGIPVITSNVTSMPEVAGDAALIVDPFSIDSIASAMTDLCYNESLRNELIEKGQEQQKLFSWQNSANRLWSCIQKTLDTLN